MPHENQTESSKFPIVGSFLKETTRAGRSAWYDRNVGIVEVPGSNPGPSTMRELRYFEARILQLGVKLTGLGFVELTLKDVLERLFMQVETWILAMLERPSGS